MTITDPKPFTDPLMETMTLKSGVNGAEYEVRIGLPYMYLAQPTAKFPVMVVLDGEGLFLSATEIARNEWASSAGTLSGGGGALPQFIVVAIALPSNPFNPVRRNFEFMPETRREEFPPSFLKFVEQFEATSAQKLKTGGAANFLKVMREEILPGVERRYRVDPALRMLFGHSAGGCFAAYTLFSDPKLFTDYVIASPGFVPDIFRREASFAGGPLAAELAARVLLTAGEKELRDPLGIVSGSARLAERLGKPNYPKLKLETWIVPDAAHSQTAVPSIGRGLSRLVGMGS